MDMRSYIISPLIFVALASCGPSPSGVSSRSDVAPLNFVAELTEEGAQTQALSDLSRRIVVQTTIKGAGIGSALGCGIAVASGGNVQNCVTAVAAGAVGGAIVGRVAGQQDVARRIEKVSPSAVVRTLREANDQMELVQSSLPARLAAHEESLAQLELLYATGEISPKKYARSRADIAAERQAMAAALIQTERHAEEATQNLLAAQSQGQTDLHWHIGATKKLAAEASSARSRISLL